MANIEELKIKLKQLEAEVNLIKEQIDDAESDISNHVYPTLYDAEGTIDELLHSKAFEDCEGAYNCGLEEYHQPFIVDGVKYLATVKFEYNRHDKMYYYIDGSKYSYKLLEE